MSKPITFWSNHGHVSHHNLDLCWKQLLSNLWLTASHDIIVAYAYMISEQVNIKADTNLTSMHTNHLWSGYWRSAPASLLLCLTSSEAQLLFHSKQLFLHTLTTLPANKHTMFCFLTSNLLVNSTEQLMPEAHHHTDATSSHALH